MATDGDDNASTILGGETSSTVTKGVKLELAPLPVEKDAQLYMNWRTRLKAKLFALAQTLLSAEVYWSGLINYDLGQIDWDTLKIPTPGWEALDLKLFSAVLDAIDVRHKFGESLYDKLTKDAHFGCGRHALALLDKAYGVKIGFQATEAFKAIVAMSCENMEGLESYLSRFRGYLKAMNEGGDGLKESQQKEMLLTQTEKVKYLSAMRAQYEIRPVGEQTYAILLKGYEDALEKFQTNKLVQSMKADTNRATKHGGSAAAAKGRGRGKGKGKNGKGMHGKKLNVYQGEGNNAADSSKACWTCG
jgi:hypothetical protein